MNGWLVKLFELERAFKNNLNILKILKLSYDISSFLCSIRHYYEYNNHWILQNM